MQFGKLIALLLWLCLVSERALAEDMVLVWRAAPPCPPAEDVRARVRELLAASKASSQQASARGSVRHVSGGYSLELQVEVGDLKAERTLRESDCAVLADAAAWLIAVAVDPAVETHGAAGAAASQPEIAPAPAKPAAAAQLPATAATKGALASSREPPGAGPRTPQSESEARAPAEQVLGDGESSRERVTVAAGLLGGVWSDGLGGPRASAGARLGLGMMPFHSELRFLQAFGRSEVVENGAELRFAGQQLALAGCLRWGRRVRGGPCLELAGQRVHAEASGFGDDADQHFYWSSGGLSGCAAAQLHGALELVLSGGLAVPLTARPEFTVSGSDLVRQVSFVSSRVELGVSLWLR